MFGRNKLQTIMMLCGILLILASCLPGQRKAAQTKSVKSELTVSEEVAMAMVNTVNLSVERMTEEAQELVNLWGEGSYLLYYANANPRAKPLGITGTSRVPVTFCNQNKSVYTYVAEEDIKGLGKMTGQAGTAILSKLKKHVGVQDVAFTKGQQLTSEEEEKFQGDCLNAILKNPDIPDGAPVVYRDFSTPVESVKKEEEEVAPDMRFAYRKEDCPAGFSGSKLFRQAYRLVPVYGPEGNITDVKEVEEGPEELIGITRDDGEGNETVVGNCIEDEDLDKITLTWDEAELGADWLALRTTHAGVDPGSADAPKMKVWCAADDKASCKPTTAEELEQVTIECRPAQEGGRAVNPRSAGDADDVERITGCRVSNVSGEEGSRIYQLDCAPSNDYYGCTGRELAPFLVEFPDCDLPCGYGWKGTVSTTYNTRVCELRSKKGNKNELQRVIRKVYEFGDTFVQCEKDDYAEKYIDCPAPALGGQMSVRQKGVLNMTAFQMKLVKDMNVRSAPDFDFVVNSLGLARDTGEVSGCNMNRNSCESHADADVLAVVVDRSIDMRTTVNRRFTYQQATCKGKIGNLFKKTVQKDACEALDFAIVVDKALNVFRTSNNPDALKAAVTNVYAAQSGFFNHISRYDMPDYVTQWESGNTGGAAFQTWRGEMIGGLEALRDLEIERLKNEFNDKVPKDQLTSLVQSRQACDKDAYGNQLGTCAGAGQECQSSCLGTCEAYNRSETFGKNFEIANTVLEEAIIPYAPNGRDTYITEYVGCQASGSADDCIAMGKWQFSGDAIMTAIGTSEPIIGNVVPGAYNGNVGDYKPKTRQELAAMILDVHKAAPTTGDSPLFASIKKTLDKVFVDTERLGSGDFDLDGDGIKENVTYIQDGINYRPGRLMIMIAAANDMAADGPLTRLCSIAPDGTDTSSVEDYIKTYFPNFSVDLISLDGSGGCLVTDGAGEPNVTEKIGLSVPWRFVDLSQDNVSGASITDLMKQIDSSRLNGIDPRAMCQAFYNKYKGAENEKYTIDPDISIEDFLYNSAAQTNFVSRAICTSDYIYNRPSLPGFVEIPGYNYPGPPDEGCGGVFDSWDCFWDGMFGWF